MDLPQATALLPAIVAAAYLFLLLIAFTRRKEPFNLVYWLMGFLAASAVWQLFAYTLPAQTEILPSLALKPLLFTALFLLMATAVYLDQPLRSWWVLIGLACIAGTVAADLLAPTLYLAWPGTLIRPTIGGIITVLFWAFLNIITFIWSWQSYRQTPFPWHANRYLFWANAVFFIIIGEVLYHIANPYTQTLGHIVRLTATIALVYATIAYLRFDVRSRFRTILAFTIIAFVSALPATGLFFFFLSINDTLDTSSTILIVVLVTSFAFLLYGPYRRFVERLVYRYFIGSEFRTNEVVRRYTQSVSRTLDMEQLSSVVIGFLSQLFDANRGALLLVTPNEQGFEIEPIPAMGQISRRRRQFTAESPFLQTLTEQHQPILQYEIDFNPNFRPINREVQPWLSEMAMEMYIPIKSGEQLTGIIALGPKSSAHTYRSNELEVVQLLADQTVAPLENARLYSELEEQNETVRLLNEDLVSQNERLEVMDKVKSDFITIASHELRTPLTQVKGYADILGAMNEENALTREQTRQIVGHINRATLQLEKLISAMLDASQIDVDEMHMTFMKTQMETVISLAMEPLAKAVRERRLHVHREQIEELPSFHADFKRLVQAFTNLLGNAVKYTPDGGHITIRGEVLGEDSEEQYIQVSVIDTGIGIDMQYHQLIFEKFFRIGDPQLHSTGNTKFLGAGPGLGLPIAKGVIEGHGGRIWVESEGEDMARYPGSTFSVVLPLRPPKMPDLPIPDSLQDFVRQSESERPAWLVG